MASATFPSNCGRYLERDGIVLIESIVALHKYEDISDDTYQTAGLDLSNYDTEN